MLQEGASLAPHVLHQVLRDEAKVLLYLLYEAVAVLEVQMPETQDFFQVVCEELSPHVQPLHCLFNRLPVQIRSDIGGTL